MYSLSPWVLDFDVNGHVGSRQGNRSDRAVPHGAFPCAGEDRWVAIAAWDDDDWARLAARSSALDDDTAARLGTFAARRAAVDEVESARLGLDGDAPPPTTWPTRCRTPASRPCPWPTWATPRPIPSSITAATSSPSTTPAWASAATSTTASA